MTQEGIDELLRLQHLAIDMLQVQPILAEEDMLLIKEVPPTEIQEWCLARIAGHQDESRRLRDSHGPARSAVISKVESYIRALRSEFNAFAPINRVLPPEMLMEIFANIDLAVYRGGIPALHVCRHWRMLLVKVPRFWVDLLSLHASRSTNSNWRIERFAAALALSAPLTLTLTLPFWSLDVVDTLIPHASRLGSLTISPPRDLPSIQRLLGQDMPRLRELTILPRPRRRDSLSPLSLNFLRLPNLQSLTLGYGLTVYYSPIMLYPSLQYLRLMHCTMRAEPSTAAPISSVQSVNDMLALFPNLKNLSVTRSLLEGDWSEELPAGSTAIVHLPRLTYLEIDDMPTYISRFLSRLVFPPTTVLVFSLDFVDPLPVPVFPAINPATPPETGLRIALDFNFVYSPESSHRPEGLARWGTNGAATRPLLISLAGAAERPDPIVRFTRELVRAVAPPPARGVTSLTTLGTWVRSPPGDEHPYLIPSPQEYWTTFLPELAGLRRLTCEDCGSARDVIGVLGQRTPPGDGEFLCPRLEQLVLVWDLPTKPGHWLDLLAAQVQASETQGPDVEMSGDDDDDDEEEGEGSDEDVEMPGEDAEVPDEDVEMSDDELGSDRTHDTESSQSDEDENDGTADGQLNSRVTTALNELCTTLGACLTERSRSGACAPIRKLSVSLRRPYSSYLRLQPWQVELVVRKLRDGLGHLVEEVKYHPQLPFIPNLGCFA